MLAIMKRTAAAICAVLWAGMAWGHEAPSGWTYDARCCSDRDCQPMRMHNVTPTDEGWRLRIEPGEHKYFKGSLDEVIPYGDPRLRKSGDTEFHACVLRSGRVACLYVPPMGY